MRWDKAYLIGGPRRHVALQIFDLIFANSIYGAVLCMIQCLLHSHASIVSSVSEYRLSEIIFFPLLKQHLNSADITGIYNVFLSATDYGRVCDGMFTLFTSFRLLPS